VMQFQTTIQRPVEVVFALIADLPNYGRWLPTSNLYTRLRDIGDDPVKLGTRYVDQGRSSVMYGQVTAFDPPRTIAFQQTTQTRLLGLPAGLEILAQYQLQPVGTATELSRREEVIPAGVLRLLQPILLRLIRTENERILAALKQHMETDFDRQNES
jgi:uncharacterized protein YndB with AHSA1/START domain